MKPDGRLDLGRLLTEFQDFYRRNAEHWLHNWDYKEAGPQLLLQAWLQRIVNGGGRIEREHGLGRRRTDLYLEWGLPGGGQQRVVLELKLQRGEREATTAESLAQTAAYADLCGGAEVEAHLLMFDVRPSRTWEERLYRREVLHAGRTITVWGA